MGLIGVREVAPDHLPGHAPRTRPGRGQPPAASTSDGWGWNASPLNAAVPGSGWSAMASMTRCCSASLVVKVSCCLTSRSFSSEVASATAALMTSGSKAAATGARPSGLTAIGCGRGGCGGGRRAPGRAHGVGAAFCDGLLRLLSALLGELAAELGAGLVHGHRAGQDLLAELLPHPLEALVDLGVGEQVGVILGRGLETRPRQDVPPHRPQRVVGAPCRCPPGREPGGSPAVPGWRPG